MKWVEAFGERWMDERSFYLFKLMSGCYEYGFWVLAGWGWGREGQGHIKLREVRT